MAEPGQSFDSQVFGALFDYGAEAVFTVHRDSRRILSANQRMGELVGRSRMSLVGRPAEEIFLADSRVPDWAARIVTRAGLHEEVALKRLDDYPAYVSLTVAHIEHGDTGSLAVCIARDTTERRNLERELIAKHAALYSAHTELELAFRRLREAQDSLAERNRELIVLNAKLANAAHRAAIGEFSAGIAHSMNNPMGAVSSALRQIVRRIDERGDAQLSRELDRFLRRCESGLQRMENIVETMRRAHRTGHLDADTRELDLAQEIEITVSLFENRLREIRAVRDFGHDIRAWLPSDAFHHVVSNLLDNAIRATPAGGELRLSLSQRHDQATLSVFNTGPGVPPEISTRLFEPFVTGREEGTGLGLCMSRRLARQWGGDVIYIPVAQGARFDVTMPTRSPDGTKPDSRRR